MRTALLALSFSMIACVAQAADLAGGWKGTWSKVGDALPVTVSFKMALTGYTGSFDSDALQVADIPFSNVSEMGGTVHWSLKGDQSTTTFEGTLARDTLVGTFNDGKDKGTFALA